MWVELTSPFWLWQHCECCFPPGQDKPFISSSWIRSDGWSQQREKSLLHWFLTKCYKHKCGMCPFHNCFLSFKWSFKMLGIQDNDVRSQIWKYCMCFILLWREEPLIITYLCSCNLITKSNIVLRIRYSFAFSSISIVISQSELLRTFY